MTSRPVPSTAEPVGTGTPGDRPHLPPVAPTSAATTSRRSHKAPLAWLPWLLLGLLALTLLAVALLARAADGGADRAGQATSGQASSSAGSRDQGSTVGASGAALSAGGQDLLAVQGGALAGLEGQRARGTATVESVVADEGFWVGNDASNRVFVFLTPEARRSAGESGFQVEAGQTVQLEGTVKGSSPEFAESAGVTDAEGSRQLVEQGAYVEATEVRLAQ